MNIFYLDKDSTLAAQYHCDKHCVKMIIEQAQLLSTAHRVLDGTPMKVLNDNGRRMTRYVLDDARESQIYKATHINHPSAVWTRQSKDHYVWLAESTIHLLEEYTHRYGKIHATTKIMDTLINNIPYNIKDNGFVDPPPAMPDYCKVKGDVVQSYRNYYVNEKKHFAKWTKRPVPYWFDK